MKQRESSPPKKIGRPLSFDRDKALEQAMLVFWRHGYESSSLSDLTAAMGISPPSIYASFGHKKQLFLEAVKLYLSGPVTPESIINEAATARDAVLGLLTASAIGFTGRKTPQGCLLASSAISCSAAARDVQLELAAIRHKIELHLKEKIVNAILKGELPNHSDATALAGLVMAVIQGLSTLARDGANREKLMLIVDAAMCSWPKK